MSPIRWMARNHVAANLLMIALILGGLLAGRALKVEVFPETDLDMMTISVVYPGAGPSEVEEGIIQPIEEAIQGQEGVKRVTSTANEGVGTVTVEVVEGEDVDLVLQDIKAAVDRIVTFPQQAERPVIKKVIRKRSVISVMVHGDVDTWTLRQHAEDFRDRVLALPDVTLAELSGVPPYQISIEVGEQTLRRYDITLEKVAAAVRAASLDLPAGSVKTRGGEILLRTKERRYHAREYEDVVVVSKTDGTMVKLGEIATIKDTFEETDERAFLGGRPAAMIEVFRVGDQTPVQVATVVKELVKQRSAELPKSVQMAVWADRSEILQSRLNLLTRNAALGLVLVIVVLGLFLQVRLAFWVTLGIPISVIGALVLMPWTDVSINMLSLFAFILVLGIVVDDAIVVGENTFTHRFAGKPMEEAAPAAAIEVGRPVIFSVLTTVAAFAPLLFVSGIMGKIMRNVPIIVISVLMISLVESLLVLPAHLSKCHAKAPDQPVGRLGRWHRRFGELVQRFINGIYTRQLRRAVRYRYITVALGIALLLLAVGVFKGGFIRNIMMPEVEGDVVHARLTMPFGTPPEQTEARLRRMLVAAQQLIGEYDAGMPGGRSVVRSVFMYIGGHMGRGFSIGGGGAHLGEVAVYLQESDKRNVESEPFANRWRQMVGEIPGAEAVSFSARLMDLGEAVDVQLAHDDFGVLDAAAERIKEQLRGYRGLTDVTDSYEEGKRELKLTLRPEARALGITQQALASQVRSAFYGAEALRILRGRNELKVMVRYPEGDRRSLANVHDMRIRTPGGGEIPFAQAAFVEDGRGYSYINRRDRRRVINVTAKADLKVANVDSILKQLREGLLPQLQADYPGLTYDMEGQQRERRESMQSLMWGFVVALLLIYVMLAVPFRSYSQPLLVMSAIPFGVIGAVLGHLLLGFNMSLLSWMGVVALSGVVINDSLVMIDFINRLRAQGVPVHEAVIDGARRRFRPIVLTTLTTFFALTPMLAETSVQARFLVPMAVSLAFGVLFGTQIILMLVPALYMILEDIRGATYRFFGREAPEPTTEQPLIEMQR
jgi:multidrug efflux pump subunit AcrB